MKKIMQTIFEIVVPIAIGIGTGWFFSLEKLFKGRGISNGVITFFFVGMLICWLVSSILESKKNNNKDPAIMATIVSISLFWILGGIGLKNVCGVLFHITDLKWYLHIINWLLICISIGSTAGSIKSAITRIEDAEKVKKR